MEIKDIAAILTSVAWPITLLVVVFYFRGPLRSLVTRVADSLKVKAMKFKIFGIEIELAPEEAKEVIDEMLQEIVEAMNELSSEEIDLFRTVHRAEGRLAVRDLFPNFNRGDELHTQLRRLRDRKLVRPIEGGRWQAEKHPVVTRFGRLVQGLYPKVANETIA
jgi:hypothetical protein